MPERPIASGIANSFTLAALGVLAYIAETLLHEAGGHGAVCLLTGGKITLLAPLYMRCSIVTPLMVAAGPAMNVLFCLLSFLALQVRSERAGALRYFFWLSFCFNGLVAAGYLLVGAATGFGDWGVLFAGIHPDWMWRVSAALIAILAYSQVLNLASRAFVCVTGLGRPDEKARARLVLLPTGTAAIVAFAAEAYGQGAKPLGLALAFGCTLFTGFTLMGVGNKSGAATIEDGALHIGFSGGLIVAAILAAVGFIFFIGPGADLSTL
jgi:hypothetical protein